MIDDRFTTFVPGHYGGYYAGGAMGWAKLPAASFSPRIEDAKLMTKESAERVRKGYGGRVIYVSEDKERIELPFSLDFIAKLLDPYIAKLLDKKFTGSLLEQCIRWESEMERPVEIRSVAVCAIDMYHGFTCEFSPWPDSHRDEYDILEQMLTAAFPDGLPK